MAHPPLVLDIDGTLTRPAGEGIDPRVFDPLAGWPSPVLLATGKAFPYPVALCHFLGIPEQVVAENGGVVYASGAITLLGDGEAARAVAEAYGAEYGLGWRGADTVNRWRETEIAVERSKPLEPLRELARDHGLEVVDTGYAYHVKDPSIDKGQGVTVAADALGIDPEELVAVGDSENDVATFAIAGRSFAVANADEAARNAADVVLAGEHADGTLSVLDRLEAEADDWDSGA